MKDVKVRRGADAASEHHLLTAKMKLKLNSYKDRSDKPPPKFNGQRLISTQKAAEFRCEIFFLNLKLGQISKKKISMTTGQIFVKF
jgi:hypothetical protein